MVAEGLTLHKMLNGQQIQQGSANASPENFQKKPWTRKNQRKTQNSAAITRFEKRGRWAEKRE